MDPTLATSLNDWIAAALERSRLPKRKYKAIRFLGNKKTGVNVFQRYDAADGVVNREDALR